jgi:type II secretory pathway component GspD/PulD (secretin)
MKKFPWACVALTALSLYSSSLLAANFSASFKNTDIREFIDTVGRNLNKTILVDPSVQGTVSVRTYNVLTEDEYYQFFLSVLDLYGLSVIPMDNGMVKVVRSSVARTAGRRWPTVKIRAKATRSSPASCAWKTCLFASWRRCCVSSTMPPASVTWSTLSRPTSCC